MRRQAGIFEDAQDVVDEIGVPDLRGRYIDRDFARHFTGVEPCFRLDGGLAQDPKSHVADQLRAFRNRNEFGGGNVAQRRVGPAHQRLVAHHPPGRQVHLRLIVDGQPGVFADRAAQIAGHRHLALRGDAHARLEKLETPAAFFLGAIEREIGVAQEIVERRPVARQGCDADAGCRY